MNIRRIASLADVFIGIWLLVSSLFWRAHSPDHAASAAIVGAGAIGLGLVALRGHDWCRWIAGGLSIWLLASVIVLPQGSAAIVVNHLLAGTLLFGFSVLPTGRGRASGAYPS